MYKSTERYGVAGHIQNMLENNSYGELDKWKKLVKDAVWGKEVIKWKATCMLYGEALSMYLQGVLDIGTHTWLLVVKSQPRTGKLVSGVLSILKGSRPCKLQCNYRGRCRLCLTYEKDTATHILMKCPSLENTRRVMYAKVLDSMPRAMAEDITNMGDGERVNILMNALNCRYNKEWQNIYESIAAWVHESYKERRRLYDNLDIEVGLGL